MPHFASPVEDPGRSQLWKSRKDSSGGCYSTHQDQTRRSVSWGRIWVVKRYELSSKLFAKDATSHRRLIAEVVAVNRRTFVLGAGTSAAYFLAVEPGRADTPT